MTDCAAIQPLLLDRAAGVLAPAAGRGLEDHLAACAACRAEASAFEETLGLVRLPPAALDELAALDGLAGELVRQRRAGRSRAAGWARAGAGTAVAAALLAALALPAFWRKAPSVAEGVPGAPAVTPSWEPPDPDDLMASAALVWPDRDLAGTEGRDPSNTAGAGETTLAAAGEEDVLVGAAEEWSQVFPTAE